jgi:hypothetical protein
MPTSCGCNGLPRPRSNSKLVAPVRAAAGANSLRAMLSRIPTYSSSFSRHLCCGVFATAFLASAPSRDTFPAGRPPHLPLALLASAWVGVTVFVYALTMTLRLYRLLGLFKWVSHKRAWFDTTESSHGVMVNLSPSSSAGCGRPRSCDGGATLRSRPCCFGRYGRAAHGHADRLF